MVISKRLLQKVVAVCKIISKLFSCLLMVLVSNDWKAVCVIPLSKCSKIIKVEKIYYSHTLFVALGINFIWSFDVCFLQSLADPLSHVDSSPFWLLLQTPEARASDNPPPLMYIFGKIFVVLAPFHFTNCGHLFDCQNIWPMLLIPMIFIRPVITYKKKLLLIPMVLFTIIQSICKVGEPPKNQMYIVLECFC